MEENINIADILKYKPQGTKLYADAFGELSMVDIRTEDELGVTLLEKDGDELLFYNDGKYNRHGEPILFPSKEMDDWSKFAWKKGDVLVSEGIGRLHVIFEGFDDDTYLTFKGKHYLCNYDDDEDYNEEEYNDYHKELILRTIEFKKDNVNDAKAYINTIEERFGGKLNLETLEVEKHQPEFKDGDIVVYGKSVAICRRIYKNTLYFYVSIDETFGLLFDDNRVAEWYRFATEEENQQLFDALAKENKAWDSVKKQIVDLNTKWTPKPFDKVVTRVDDDAIWTANIFSHIDSYGEYNTIGCVGGYPYCLPYNEETAKLIGTTNNWEG